MNGILLIFLIALTLTAVSLPWIRRLALKTGFVDVPASRKLHSTPMPLLGGLGIVLGASLAFIFFASNELPSTVAGVMLSLGVVALTGLIDDRYHLPARLKFGAELLAVAVLIYFDVHVRLPLPDWLNYAITVLWVVGLANAINFLDNMDGLSAGVSAVAASFILLLGAQNNQFLVAGLAAAVLGACLGFLRYNFPPAKIFMGDVGALFLGFVLAILGLQLRFPQNTAVVTWMVPVFILAVPIFDTTLVVISRIRRGLSPNTAGKDHTSHRLARMGFSHRETVLILYLFTGISGMIALFITRAALFDAYAVAAICSVVALYFVWHLEKNGMS